MVSNIGLFLYIYIYIVNIVLGFDVADTILTLQYLVISGPALLIWPRSTILILNTIDHSSQILNHGQIVDISNYLFYSK